MPKSEVHKSSQSYSPMSCGLKFFWGGGCLLLWWAIHASSELSLTNVLQLPVWSLLHTSTPAAPYEHQCVKPPVKLWEPRSSLNSLLHRRPTEDRRPLGQLQNNESLKSCPGLPRIETPSLPPSQALPPSFHPSPPEEGLVMSAGHTPSEEAAFR